MILDMFSLKGKVAVVTGSNTGLGQGICRAFVEAGAKVVGVSRRPSTETAEMLGENFYNVLADLSSCDVIPKVVEGALEGSGRNQPRQQGGEGYDREDYDVRVRHLQPSAGVPHP